MPSDAGTSVDTSLRLVDDPLSIDFSDTNTHPVDDNEPLNPLVGYSLSVSRLIPPRAKRIGDWSVLQGFIARTGIRVLGSSQFDFNGNGCGYIDEGTSFIVKSAVIANESMAGELQGRLTGDKVAVKHVNPLDSDERLESVCLEILSLMHPPLRDHKNIIDLLGITWTNEGEHSLLPAIVVEFAEYGSLDKYLVNTPLDSAAKANLCIGVAEGIDILHQCSIIHGDVKCENVLVTRDLKGAAVPKLADFGFSFVLPHEQAGAKLVGTPRWNAPELSEGDTAGFPRDPGLLPLLDIYSYGLLVWRVLLDGRDPFNDPVNISTEDVLVLKILSNEPLRRACLSVRTLLVEVDNNDPYLLGFENVFKATLPRNPMERLRNLSWVKNSLSVQTR